MTRLRSRNSKTTPATLSTPAGVSLSYLASVILHVAVIGGGLFASYHFWDAGASPKEGEIVPVYVTLIQDPAPETITADVKTAAKNTTEAPKKVTEKAQTEILTIKGEQLIEKPEQKKQQQKQFEQSQKNATQITTSSKPKAETANIMYVGSGKADIRYQDTVRAAIESHRIYPRYARRKKMEGEAVIHIRIDSNGNILKTRFLKTTGHHILDEAVLSMVKAADPLPPIPADLHRTTVTLQIPIGFQLR